MTIVFSQQELHRTRLSQDILQDSRVMTTHALSRMMRSASASLLNVVLGHNIFSHLAFLYEPKSVLVEIVESYWTILP
jgi:hypothetical protein